MDKYRESKTWQFTLGREYKKNKAAVEMLRSSFLNTREKAKTIAADICNKLPYFTVHDITHIDALWIAADTLLWDKNENALYELNPAEAYVLGLAFLLHDLGMGLVSYSDGFEGLRKEKYFRDSLASEFRKAFDRTIDASDWCRLDGDYNSLNKEDRSIVDRAIAATLRDLHSKKAEKLALQKWQNHNGNDIYIIEDTDLREAFGELAGKLAASHGWGYNALREGFSDASIGTTSVLPREWTIDARKLALILRLSDAIQIDDSRAPSFLMALKKLEGESLDHHKFQNKLNQPAVKGERLFFTSKSSFKLEDMEAWWLCHDTLRMIDEELRSADTLLLETGRNPFLARGVYGLSSAKDLSTYVKVEGWTPLDTKIRVGNVGKLVKMLGGEQLYGKNSKWVPFRELIQNGTDAVRARRLLKPDRYTGEVRISFEECDGEQFILFFDNGIGMSEAVLTGPFLDFGQSFWGTGLMNREFPGLAAKGFKSTGRFGIGFYSVFMWSDDVKVITKRFGDNQRTLVLEFKNSVSTRPTLRAASEDEAELIDGSGTVVRIRLSNELADSIKSGKVFANLFGKPLSASLANLCPSIDCDLYIASNRVVIANDWMDLSPSMLLSRVIPNNVHFSLSSSLIVDNIKYIDSIACDDRIIGRAAVSFAKTSNTGCIVSSGFYTQFCDEFLGIIDGSVLSVSRNSGESGKFTNWALAQVNNTYIQSFDAQNQARIAGIISSFGVTPHKLYIAESKAGSLTFDDIVALSKSCTDERMILLSHNPIHISEGRWMRESIINVDNNVLWCVSQNDSARLLPLIVNAVCFGFSSIQSSTNAIVEYSCARTIIGLKKADGVSAWIPLKKDPFAIIYRNAIPQKEDIIDQ